MKKQLKIVVLAKQVPDTRNVGKDAMTPEGTVNRAALPAIFNPEDLNALEMALALKDRTDASTVHILTMGPQRAADIIRDAMFRGYIAFIFCCQALRNYKDNYIIAYCNFNFYMI